MKLISWNVRGLSAPNKRRLIKSQLDLIKCDLVMLQETKLCDESASVLFTSWKKWNFLSCPSYSASGGLALLWNAYNIEVQLVSSAVHWMLFLVTSKVSKVKVWLFNIYAPSRIQGKKKLWRDLIRVASPLRQGSLVVFGGDFNAILDPSEKSGGIFPNKRIMEDFGNFILHMDLFDCKSQNGIFTWTNMRRDFSQIAERLDRFLLFENWLQSDLEFSSSILPMSGSDLYPISLCILEDKAPFWSPFKFEPMWFRDASFLPLLRNWWESAPFCAGSRMFQFVNKMKFLKLNIKEWNNLHFKNIFHEK